ncbi:IPT/TIG domain-containing protein [Geodermatophilus sp. SYSU D00758]
MGIYGGQGMHFRVSNANVLGTQITISPNFGSAQSATILPLSSHDFLFQQFGEVPLGWTFDVASVSDAFIVTWCLWSSWVPRVPQVAALVPSEGKSGDRVSISGAGFAGFADVRFGSESAAIFAQSDAQLDVAVPTGGGTVDVTVATPAGTSMATGASRFTYLPLPEVSVVEPRQGFAGDVVTVRGRGFGRLMDLSFGFQSVVPIGSSESEVTVVAPDGMGTVDILVTTPGGTSGAGENSRFTYVSAPEVTGLLPHQGQQGDQVSIFGRFFVGPITVQFGFQILTPSVLSEEELVVTVPFGTGTIDVAVTNRAGTSTPTFAGTFTYLEPPVIAELRPSQGAVGDEVTVVGSGLADPIDVSFGFQRVNPISVSDTELTVVAPLGSGLVVVAVTTRVGTSPVTAGAFFTYLA